MKLFKAVCFICFLLVLLTPSFALEGRHFEDETGEEFEGAGYPPLYYISPNSGNSGKQVFQNYLLSLKQKVQSSFCYKWSLHFIANFREKTGNQRLTSKLFCFPRISPETFLSPIQSPYFNLSLTWKKITHSTEKHPNQCNSNAFCAITEFV